MMNLTNVTKDLEHFFCYHCGSGFSGQHLSTCCPNGQHQPESYWMSVIAPWSLVILGHHFLDILWGGHLAEGYLFEASLKVLKFDFCAQNHGYSWCGFKVKVFADFDWGRNPSNFPKQRQKTIMFPDFSS